MPFVNIMKEKTIEKVNGITTEIYKKIKNNTYKFNFEEIKIIFDYVIKYGN